MNRSIFFGLIPVLWLAGCSGSHKEKAEAAAPPTVKATLAKATQEDWPETIELTGTVRARVESQLSSRAPAWIREVRVRQGDTVASGQVLAVLDAQEVESGIRSAQAAVAEAESAIPEADQGLAGAQAQLDLANSTLKRMEDLFSKRSISQQELDEVRAKHRGADANVKMAEARRRQLDSRIRRAREGVESAKVSLAWATLKAPFAGVITERRAEPGVLAAPGMLLFRIEQSSAGYEVIAPLDETRLRDVSRGTSARIQFDTGADPVEAKVSELVPAADPQSRTVDIKIPVPARAGIRSGQFARVSIAGKSRPVVAVPKAAVRERGQLQMVFVHDSGSARSRLITAGARAGDRMEVLSGLKAGESVVSPVSDDLVDGARIEVRP
ncbi:MAG: efflux RND transporter periplasmic adaptor subunit [Bryobacteraceae bacterium]|nr:efflux RND transporter periplasmic adaptor subunit [Bryobacteraceae bacterium]